MFSSVTTFALNAHLKRYGCPMISLDDSNLCTHQYICNRIQVYSSKDDSFKEYHDYLPIYIYIYIYMYIYIYIYIYMCVCVYVCM